MAATDVPRAGTAGRPLPGPGLLWALGLACLHAVVVGTVPLLQLTYGAFLPGGSGMVLATTWTGQAAGVLLLVVVLTLGRWWRPAGLASLRPPGATGPRESARLLLPLAVLVVVGAVVAAVQYGRVVPPGLDEGAVTAASVLLGVVLSTVATVLLVLGLVPLLLRGPDDGPRRSTAYVVVVTAVVVGLSRLAVVAVTEAFSPDGVSSWPGTGEVAVVVLARGLLALPLVAVAVRTRAPWLLLPVLLVTTTTLLPNGWWFWAYAGLGAAVAAWLVATEVRGPAGSGTTQP